MGVWPRILTLKDTARIAVDWVVPKPEDAAKPHRGIREPLNMHMQENQSGTTNTRVLATLMGRSSSYPIFPAAKALPNGPVCVLLHGAIQVGI